jgi:GNAT superfamily N-acetyltransferase
MNDGHRAFVAYMNGKAAGFGWMATKKAFIGELNHHFMMPAQNRYLWNFRTLAEYRGLGIYPALLQYIVRQERPKAAQFWIIHAPENFSSRRGISKAGFRYVGKLYTQIGQGALIEFPPSGPRYLDLLSQMGFNSSNDKGASCWNCSSPYLKNRTEDCCCFVTSDRCVEMAVSL